MELRLRFTSTIFVPMKTKYLSRFFLNNSYHPIIEIIDYYIFSKLIYYTNYINIDRYTEFYNNLVKIDDHIYTTRSGGRVLYLLMICLAFI